MICILHLSVHHSLLLLSGKMDKLFWITPRLAGRPGPDFENWNLGLLRKGGIRAVLSLNDGILCDLEKFAALGIDYECIPLSENSPPKRQDVQFCMIALPKAYEFVRTHLRNRQRVMVHCSAGNDRTGLFLSYYLIQSAGITPDEAIQAVRQVRPSALSAPGWEPFARRILSNFTAVSRK